MANTPCIKEMFRIFSNLSPNKQLYMIKLVHIATTAEKAVRDSVGMPSKS